MEVGRTPRLLTAWPSTAPSGNEMCVPARGFPVGRRCRLTIIDNHQPSRHGHLTAGAVIASAGLRPLVPYSTCHRSGPFLKRPSLPPRRRPFSCLLHRISPGGPRFPQARGPATRGKPEGPTGDALVLQEAPMLPILNRVSLCLTRSCRAATATRSPGPAGPGLASFEPTSPDPANPERAGSGIRTCRDLGVRPRSTLSLRRQRPYLECLEGGTPGLAR